MLSSQARTGASLGHTIRPGVSRFWQRAPIVALCAAVALLLAGLILAVANERAYKVQKVTEVTVEGRFLSLIASAALDFNDRAAAQGYLSALKTNPEAEAAAIYDAHGALFASYVRAGAPPLPPGPPPAGSFFEGNRLIAAIPVIRHNRTLGSVYLDIATQSVGRRLPRYIGIGLLVTMAALLVAVLGAAHSALGRANRELERRAIDLGAANRQLRSQIEEREKAEEALRHSQKMEAIGRLTGGVAHDFNNLLTIVAGNLDLIERMADALPAGGVPRDPLCRLLAGAQRGLARGEKLTRQLLALSRPEPLAARIVEVNATLADFAALLQQAIGETITLRLQLGDGQWFCRLDPTQFEAAILNLAINARDAMASGGTLTIAISLEQPTSAMETGRDATQQIAIAIGDTGAGMPPEVLRRIFEPFYTTKPVGKGSGLGLAQVWAFVTQSGGHVSVDSAPGSGTVFRLWLPLSQAASEAAAADRPRQAAAGGTERILVVEDEDDVREVAAATLERLGYRTVVARDGREALTILNGGGGFDLLFTDYVMPNGLNGVELAREALRLRPGIKVLLTSGYVRQANASADNSQVDGFALLAKPYRSADLAARIREIFDAIAA